PCVGRWLPPRGARSAQFDMLLAGAPAARFSALQSGAVDAAILLPPFNFYAESAGFRSLGLTVDYAPDLPFSGSLANRNWAARNSATLQKLMAIGEKSIAWFSDPQNPDEAIRLLPEATNLKPHHLANAHTLPPPPT